MCFLQTYVRLFVGISLKIGQIFWCVEMSNTYDTDNKKHWQTQKHKHQIQFDNTILTKRVFIKQIIIISLTIISSTKDIKSNKIKSKSDLQRLKMNSHCVFLFKLLFMFVVVVLFLFVIFSHFIMTEHLRPGRALSVRMYVCTGL